MKAQITKLRYLAIKEEVKTLSVISKWLGLFIFSTAVGAGLTFGSLLAFVYIVYGS